MSQAELEPPEDSIPLRLIVFGMTITCITASCIFVPTHWGVIVLTVALALIGSLVSYQYRHQNQKWSQWIVLAGMLGVGANALNEFVHPMNSVTDFWGPVVHFIAGTFALHSFDLKARSNINLSAMLGALILCALSPVARSIYFGGIVFGYICLGSLMLYFDCLSRTQHNWLKKPMQIAPVSLSGGERHRTASGSTNLTMGLLPLAALIVFLAVPRSDNLLDIILSSLKTLNPAALLQLLPRFVPEMAPQPKKNPYNPDLLKKLKEPKALKDKPKDVKKDKAKEEKKPLKDKKKDKKEDPKKDPVKKPEPKALSEKEKKEAEAKAKKKEQQKKAHAAKKGAKPKAPPKKHAKPKPMSAADAKQLIDKEFGEIFPEKLNVERKHNHLLSQVILFRVTSTRLFYPRLSVFDTFDGDTWTRSKDEMPAKVVEIKSGGGPNDKPVLRDGIERDQNGKPIHELSAEQEADLEVARDSFFKEADTESGFGATEAVHYIFSKSDKSTYDVGKAQSFRVPRKVPYIDLTQSYDLLVDIGKDVPSCWIPRSLGFDGSTALVDDYGTISFPEKLKKGTNYKVTSSWPVNDLNSMRDANPLSADDELQLRNKLANYLQLPEGIDEEVKAFGDKAIGGTGNWFEQAEKLCHAVRENSTFTDEDLPPETPATPAGAPAAAPAPDASTDSGAAPADPSKTKGAAPAVVTPAAAPAAGTDKGTDAPVPPAPPATTSPANSGPVVETGSSATSDTTDTAGTTGTPADGAKPAESAEQAKATGADTPADAASAGEDKSPANANNSELGDKVYDFLFGRRLGDSRRFATAFAVLCRQQGLPCRIVVGFNPGTFNKLNGTHEIYGSDTHTWVEVYIPDYGWVAFDATPDGSFPEQKRDEGYGFAQALKALQEALGITDGQITPKTLLTIGAILLALLFLIAGIIYGIIVLRRYLKKRREGQNWSGQEWKVYQSMLKDLKKIKIVREPTESQKQFVERVSNITKDRIRQGGTMAEELPVALANFFSVYEAIHFGDAESVDFKSGIPDLRDKASKVSALARASKPGAAEKAVKSRKGDAASAVKERGKPTAADSAVRRGPRP